MKTVIFDFDGTIADSIPLILNIVNDVLLTYGYPKIEREEFEDLRNKNIISILKAAKISYFFLPFMFLHGKMLFKKRVLNLQPIEGIKEVISKLIENGYKIGIVTSNSKLSVSTFLRENNFPEINFLYSSINIFGKDRVIRKCLDQNNINHNEVIYVGDEIRDIQACEKAGIRCISVGWGFNSVSSLKTANPKNVVEKVSELYNKIVNF